MPTEGLPDLLALNGSIVAIDAAGCQKKIVAKIVSKGADYIIGLKGKPPMMWNDEMLQYIIIGKS
ncbi:MAG: hypothetical protein ACI4QT_04370 [Kiritimatiellia bacterium]